MTTASNQADFLKKIQDTSSGMIKKFKYSLADLVTGSGDFFIGKEGGPNKVGGDYYLGAKSSEADYLADVRNARGNPTRPSPFRLRMKVAVLIDPSGPITTNRPHYILVSRKKMQGANAVIRSSSGIAGPGPLPQAQQYYYSDFPKGSISYEQCVMKDTSADNTTQIDSWPALKQLILAASYSEVREEARLSELDWTMTGLHPDIFLVHEKTQYGVNYWNLFFIVYGILTDHIKLYSNNAQLTKRTTALNNPTLAQQLSARAAANFQSTSLPKSYRERGSIQVVEIGTTDPNTWLQQPSHEKLIYSEFLNLG